MLLRYASALFSSAVLLFWVQLLLGKLLLPRFGGTPAVWNGCLLFYQTLLLIGYVYADRVARIVRPRRALVVHAALLALGGAFLPLRLPAWTLSDASPVAVLLATLTVAIGVPFVALAATAPLLQRWFARLDLPASADPYPLYAVSNLGSMLGLLAYPFLLEPWVSLAEQRVLWSALYCVAAVLVIACGLALPRTAVVADHAAAKPVPLGRRLQWLLLSFVPASLLYGTTAMLATDLAAVPLLWVVPLALYLLTFVLAFAAHDATRVRRTLATLLPLLLAALVTSFLLNLAHPIWLIPAAHLGGLFLVAYVLHSELAARRPSAELATSFYVWMALGGMLAGIWSALLAPLLFDTIVEYPLALVLAGLMLHALDDADPNAVTPALVVRMAALALVASIVLAGFSFDGFAHRSAGVVVMVALLVAIRYAFALGLAPPAITLALAVAIAQYFIGGASVLHVERSFFGVHRVARAADGSHIYQHGTTLHGRQSSDPAHRREALAYFHVTGPVGQLLSTAAAGRFSRVAVLGLGAGTLAAYSRAGDAWDFYEIDPTVERIARDAHFFTFLEDGPGNCRVVIGDARLALLASPERYDLLIADAFSSDAMPVHLFTREAFVLYVDRLRPAGVIAVNVTNRFLDLVPVLAAIAADLDLVGVQREDEPSPSEAADGKSASHWAVLARNRVDLGAIALDERWRPLHHEPMILPWTDDYSGIGSVIRMPK